MTKDDWWRLVEKSAASIRPLVKEYIDEEMAVEFDYLIASFDRDIPGKSNSMMDLLVATCNAVEADKPAGFSELCLLCDADVELP